MRDERRSFLKALALTPLGPAALAGAAVPPAPVPPAPAAPVGAPAPPTGTDAVAEALAEAVRREHAHLDDAAVAAVKKEIASSLEGAARMRSALRLGNGDEPVTFFSARGRR